jgi:hypothetical protein
MENKETLEEAAKKYDYTLGIEYCAFIEGANWHAERSYSGEEVLEILFELSCNNDTDKEELEQWFEQFKKK